MASLLDAVLFTPTLGGTTDWIVSAAVQGYLTPAASGAVNGKTYFYRAESADLSQWEEGFGVWTSGTSTLTRGTVLFNSAGTTSKINFSTAPQVGIVVSSGMLLQFDDSMSLTTAQQLQARNNIGAGGVTRTRTVLTSGTALTYNLPTNCKAINVRLLGAGAGGAGGSGGGAGTNGGNSTFGGSLTAGGGGAGQTFGNAPASGGTGTGGDYNIQGNPGGAWGPGASSNVFQGAIGASGPWGGAGYGGWPSAAGGGAQANSGSGGGGGGGSFGGNSGGAGGYVEKLITAPASTYTYTIGGGGTAGSAGGSAAAGGAGGSGVIIIDEFY